MDRVAYIFRYGLVGWLLMLEKIIYKRLEVHVLVFRTPATANPPSIAAVAFVAEHSCH